MSSKGSVSRQLRSLKAGDPAAVRLFWQRYFQRLVRLARHKLTGRARRAADEEDVALAAFARFCQRAEQGRLPQVRDRKDVWRVLVTVTARMAVDQVRRENRQKRGGPNGDGQGPTAAGALAEETNLDQIASRQPTPEFIAQVAEECERLLQALDDAELMSIAVWKTEGYTNEQIASELGCVLRTVERKLQAIRLRWSEDASSVQR